MKNAGQYRDKASEMRRLAEADTVDLRGRVHWLHMAQQWEGLALQADYQEAIIQAFSPTERANVPRHPYWEEASPEVRPYDGTATGSPDAHNKCDLASRLTCAHWLNQRNAWGRANDAWS